MNSRLFSFATMIWFTVGGPAAAADSHSAVSPKAGVLLETYCMDCHGEDSQKGDVRLDNLGGMALEARLDLLNRVQEQLFLKQMPPRKKEQPSDEDRESIMVWVSEELGKHNASRLKEKLRYPGYGNYVDHVSLSMNRITR